MTFALISFSAIGDGDAVNDYSLFILPLLMGSPRGICVSVVD